MNDNDNLMFNPDKSVVNYRFVMNDALCRPWEPMPEAGTTLKSLIEFLKGCTTTWDLLGDTWDYTRLCYGGSFDPHVVRYGLRSQFWIPLIPQREDFVWNETNPDLYVECCGQKIYAQEDVDNTMLCPDEGYLFYCSHCGKHTRRYNGKVHRSIKAAYDYWQKMYENKGIK